jgi:hypothetical protein
MFLLFFDFLIDLDDIKVSTDCIYTYFSKFSIYLMLNVLTAVFFLYTILIIILVVILTFGGPFFLIFFYIIRPLYYWYYFLLVPLLLIIFPVILYVRANRQIEHSQIRILLISTLVLILLFIAVYLFLNWMVPTLMSYREFVLFW